MKKSLLAIAVASALPGIAAAQVTVGGLMDLSYSSLNDGKMTRGYVSNSNRSSSQLYFRGEENIGNGLKGIFHIEMGFNPDTGVIGTLSPNSWQNPAPAANNAAFARRSVVGAGGNFGSVLLGRDYTPLFSAMGHSSVVGYSYWGSILQTMNGTGGAAGQDVRWSNMVQYWSPVMNGFQLKGGYTTGASNENPTSSSQGTGTALAGTYSAGGLNLGGGWYSKKLEADGTKSDATGIGGNYRMGAFQVAAGMGTRKDTLNGVTKVDTKMNHVSGAYYFGANKLSYQYVKTDPTGASNTYSSNMVALEHALSKRTVLYANYAKGTNQANGKFSLFSNGDGIAAAANGADPSALAIGIVHNF